MKAYVFPGQGAQFSGMGQELYENFPLAKQMFEQANDILGFRISDIMFHGTIEELKATAVTQPAVFIHSIISYMTAPNIALPDMVAGHSLGEFSALVACRALTFESALQLVAKRAEQMQIACKNNPSTMVAIIKFDDTKTEQICREITDEIVVPANYNSPQQLTISGSLKGIAIAIERLRAAGAKRIIPMNVGGAFHSPLMLSAQAELSKAIDTTTFSTPICPIYQNISAMPTLDIDIIRENLKQQLTHPVRWTQSVKNMIADGATEFIEFGPGNVLQGLIRRINPDVNVQSMQDIFYD